MTPKERAALVRGIRELTGAEIEKLKEQERYIGHPLRIEEVRSHAEPEFPLLKDLDEEKELLKAYERLGKNSLPFAMERTGNNNESMAIDRDGRKYLFPGSRWDDLPATGKEMADLLECDFDTLRRAAANPFIKRMQLEALPAGARIIAAGQLADSHRLITPQIARSCKVPGLPAFEKANAVLDLPVKSEEKNIEFTADKVLEAISDKALTIEVQTKGHEIEKGGWSR